MFLTAPMSKDRDDGLVPFSRDPGGPRVSVIIPVLNEEASLPQVLRDVPDFAEVVVVDGLSQDRSVDVALRTRPGCRIVLESKKGKGAAIRAGVSVAAGYYVVLLDADCSHDPSEITQMLEHLERGFDVVHGSRFLAGGRSEDLTRFRLVGNRFFVWLVNSLHETNYTDVCYGYMALRRSALARLSLDADSMEIDAHILIAARWAGLRVIEVPSFERKRYAGHSRLNAFRDGWRILWKIVSAWWSPRWAASVVSMASSMSKINKAEAHRSGVPEN